MAPTSAAIRLWALLSVGVLAVHEGRYRLGYGSEAGAALDAQGHGYLQLATSLAALLLLLALASFLARLATCRDARGEPGAPLRRLWALTSLSLIAVYCGQELLEGLLAPGHPSGLAGVLGTGGWSAIPIALAVGWAIARLASIARRVIVEVARRRTARPRLPRAPRRSRRPSLELARPPQRGIAERLAARAPPALA